MVTLLDLRVRTALKTRYRNADLGSWPNAATASRRKTRARPDKRAEYARLFRSSGILQRGIGIHERNSFGRAQGDVREEHCDDEPNHEIQAKCVVHLFGVRI